jgi:hypothetical protein
MPRPVIGTPEDAWNDFDAAVWRCEALGWNLTAWTSTLLAGHWEKHAATMGRIDRSMWGPTLALGKADRVSRAVKVAGAWDDAILASGILGFVSELEHEGRTNTRLADTVADWRCTIEGARDALAGACVDLLAVTLVATGGGPRPSPRPTGLLKKSRPE